MATIQCLCPPRAGEQRHPSDTVTLRPSLGFREATTIRKEIALLYAADEDASFAEVLAILTEFYILFGVESWSLVDADDKPLPVTRESIRTILLGDMLAATVVGDEADALYAEAVMRPLIQGALTSSLDTPIDASTSPTIEPSPKAPTPSSPSSTITSPTDVIERTSLPLVGVSN